MPKFELSLKHLGIPVVLAVLLAIVFPDGAFVLLCSAIGGAVMLFVASKVIGALLAPSQKQHEAFLQALGFRPCTEEESVVLDQSLRSLKHWRGAAEHRLGDAVQAQVNGRTVYQYYFSDVRGTATPAGSIAARGAVREFEMIVPWAPGAAIVAMLGKNDGATKLMLEKGGRFTEAMAARWSSEALPMAVSPLPPELVDRGVAVLVGPPDRSAAELLDAERCALLAQGAELGVEHVVARDGHALLLFRRGYVPEGAYARLPEWVNALCR